MDLDDDELKATRMMNGADRKGRVNKMKQDIEKIENLIKKCDKCKLKECINCEISWNEVQAIKRFHKAYKELEEKNKKKSIEIICYQEELENSIPVSLVEEKILNPMKEEHDKAIKGFIKRDIPQCIEEGGIAQELGYFIGKIEELLEKRK